MHRDEANIGDLVIAEGYGGFAKILSIDEDGVGPHGHPKYRATVKFGPNNPTSGRARNIDVYDFALGKLSPASEEQQIEAEPITREAIIARLAELEAQLA
jgi:hypothetical protein